MSKKKQRSADFEEAVRQKRRVKKEEVYKPSSVRLHKELIKHLDGLAQKEAHGFKQDLINYAIAKVLREEYGIKIDLT
ncbi:hypothetical protein [Bacillus sp. 37MA]|uniref:hypothetical protein n=1 Tax=Bacillus sp. 37MA TaxID=1132442 RepID=UPI00037F9BB7|nr:hypothetical protein [Bacillus sp. 37MA]